MALADSITRMSTGTYQVTRYSPASYGDDGVLDPAATTVLSVQASVQPLGGEDLIRMPEGMRTRELRQVFTLEPLSTGAQDAQPDIVEIDGASWEVQTVENWLSIAGYCRAVVARVEAS